MIRDTNNNPLVFDTFRIAVAAKPDAHPLFHSDRGYQYTNRSFHRMLAKAGMTQSMTDIGLSRENADYVTALLNAGRRDEAWKKLRVIRCEMMDELHNYMYSC